MNSKGSALCSLPVVFSATEKDRFQKAMGIPEILEGSLFAQNRFFDLLFLAPYLEVYECLLSNLFETYSAEALNGNFADFKGTSAINFYKFFQEPAFRQIDAIRRHLSLTK